MHSSSSSIVMSSVLISRVSCIIVTVGFDVTVGGWPSKFEKWSFHFLTRSSRLIAHMPDTGILFIAATSWAFMISSYTLFASSFPFRSCKAWYWFRTSTVYLSFMLSVRSKFQSYLIFFLLDYLLWHNLSLTLAVTIRWSDLTEHEVLYASQFKALFFHLLLIRM